jgi:predicted lipid-binding transport protein (Tim44 family)
MSRKVSKRGPRIGHIKYLEERVKQLESLLTPEQMLVFEKMNAESGNIVDEEDVSLKVS